jgi:hypothetical protein
VGLLDELSKGKMLKGLAIGAGVYILAPKLLPVIAEAAKPLVKGVMKSGMLCYEKGKEVLAEVGETTEDLWAEVKSEMDESLEENLPIVDASAEEEDQGVNIT